MSALRRLVNTSNGTKLLIFCVCLSCVAVLLLSKARAKQPQTVASSSVQKRTQPLDPLTSEETELATRVASADGRVKEALGTGRQQLIRVEFLAPKSSKYRESNQPDQMKIGRYAAVIFYRYDQDLGIHVIVDLENRSVGEVTKLQGKVVPLAAAEVADAFALALRNDRVQLLLGSRAGEFKVAGLSPGERPENRVEGLRVVSNSPKDPCFMHRCVDLIFRQREGYIAGTEVTVDLTAQTVRVERTGQ